MLKWHHTVCMGRRLRALCGELDANKDVMDVNYRGILQKNYDKWFPSSEE